MAEESTRDTLARIDREIAGINARLDALAQILVNVKLTVTTLPDGQARAALEFPEGE